MARARFFDFSLSKDLRGIGHVFITSKVERYRRLVGLIREARYAV